MINSKFDKVENMSSSSRLTRILFGATLIGFTMHTSVSPLGWFAVLPLLAVYPIFTAITGWSPVKALVEKMKLRTVEDTQLSFPVRVLLGAIGIAAIASVYVTSGPLGSLVLLPLLGVYPLFMAILGEEPVSAIFARGLEPDSAEPVSIDGHDRGEYEGDYRHAA